MKYWVQRENGVIVNFHVAIEGKERRDWEIVDDIPDELKYPAEPESIEDTVRRIVREELNREKLRPRP